MLKPRAARPSAIGLSVDAIFFDFDGVIVESVDIKTRAFAALYEPFGLEIVDKVVAHHEAHGGMGRHEKLRHYHRAFLGRLLDDGELEALCAEFSARVEQAVAAAPAVRGAEDTLAELQGRAALFVVSATPTAELRRIVAARGLAPRFDEVHGGPEGKPAILQRVTSARGLSFARCLMIGDSLQDYAAATAVGMPFMARIAQGGINRFPADCPAIPDLVGLASLLASPVEA